MNFEEMIAELTKQNQQLVAEMQRLNTLTIRNQAQIDLLGYLLEQKAKQEDEGQADSVEA